MIWEIIGLIFSAAAFVAGIAYQSLALIGIALVFGAIELTVLIVSRRNASSRDG